MKKRFLRILSSLIVVAMIVCSAPLLGFVGLDVPSFVDYFTLKADAADLTYGDYTYAVSGSNATITKYNGTDSTVSIPSKIGSYTVTAIGQEAFRDNKTLISVTIPATVVAIGTSNYGDDGAFQNCTKMQNVTIVEGTTNAYVGKDAFAGCASLQSITVPGNYTTIRSGAFRGCISLKSATFKKSSSLSANQTIEANAFQECSSLTELSLPTTLKSIGNYAFISCTSLKNLNIPEGVVTIGEQAFRYDSELLSVSIPSTVTAIGTSNYGGDGAFQDCTKLQTVTIVEGTTDAYVGKDAFAGCNSLKSITVPGNYTTIRSGAFRDCISLTSVIYEQSDYIYANQTIEANAFQGCSSLTELSLPTTLKSIGNYAFISCTSLKNLNIPEGVVTIGEQAFRYDSELLSVSIPSTVTAIGTSNYGGDGAFQDCTKLQTVTIVEGTTDAYVGKDAFAGCTSLKSITVPGNYTTIRSGAFVNCTSLASVIYEQSDYIYANQTIEANAFQGCSSLTELSLPTTLKSIGNYAFSNCTSLKNLNIPEGVVTIGEEAFRYDSELRSVFISSTVATIGTSGYGNDGAFQDCTKLQTVIIANGTKDTTIGKDAFKGCVALTTAHIPSNVTSILEGAFSNCGNVTICNTTSDCYAKTYADANKIPFRICSGHEENDFYTVTLNANGGTVSPTSAVVSSGSSVTLPTPAKSYKITYNSNGGSTSSFSQSASVNCLGWSTSSGAISASYRCGTSFTPSGNTTLYAVWGNSTSAQISSQKPSRSGYTFLGWSTSSSATTASYVSGSAINLNGNITLYAVWKKNPVDTVSYTLTYNANGGSYAPYSESGSTSYVVSSVEPVRDGYLFLGWSTNSSASSASFHAGDIITLTSDTTLYAVWKKNPVDTVSYTLTYNANGGSYAPYSESGSTSYVVSSVEPVRNGYLFLGWSTNSSASSASFHAGDTITLTSDTTLYAVWKIKPVVDPNPSTEVCDISISKPSDTTIEYGDSIILHMEIKGALPEGAYIEWSESNGNFDMNVSDDGLSCKITPRSSGKTVFRVTAYDEDGNVIGYASQEMTSKAGLWERIVAFFKNIFGLTRTIPALFKYVL